MDFVYNLLITRLIKLLTYYHHGRILVPVMAMSGTQVIKTMGLSRDDEKVVKALQKKLGVSFSSLVRMALRRLAEIEAVKVA